MNVFFPFSYIQINMLENNGEEGTSDPSQEVRDLQTSLDQLRHENEDLRTAATAAKSAELFFSGLSQGIDKVIKKYKPSATVTANKNNDTDENDKDNDSSDSDSNDGNNKSDVPDCFQVLKKKVKTDNTGPPISEEIATLLESCWHAPFPKEEILETLDSQVRLKNVDAVKLLEIDPEVPINPQDRKNEKEYRYIGNAICGAGKCFAYLMDMLASAERHTSEKTFQMTMAGLWLTTSSLVSEKQIN